MEKKFSVKEFFKSTAFKCIYVLLAIVLVCGVLLAFCNDLFEVTAEEKLNRTLSKIYGQSVEAEDALKDGMTLEFDNGEINSAYLVKDDGNYLVNASGTGGYYGSVACWIVVEISDNSLSGIRSVIVDKADNASEFTNRISEDNLEYFADSFDGEEEFTVSDWQGDSLHGGATPQLTMTAIVNAVNTALEFVRTQLLGEVIVPDEPSPFEKFSYYSETYISDDTTVELAEDGTSVIFHITTGNIVTGASKVDITVGSDGAITDYTIVSEGTTADDAYLDHINDVTAYVGKKAADILPLLGTAGEGGFAPETSDSTLHGGATYTNFYYAYAAMFAASNYEVYAELAQYLPPAFTYTDYIDVDNTTWNIADDESSVVFHIVTKDYSPAKAFNIDITVNADGTIADFTITKNGSTDDTFKGYMDENILSGAMFETKNAAAILDMFKEPTGEDGEFVKNDLEDSSLASGATDSTYNNAGYSNFLCVYSALFAAENYDLLISGGENA